MSLSDDDDLHGSFVDDDALLAPLPLTLHALQMHNAAHGSNDAPGELLQGEGEDELPDGEEAEPFPQDHDDEVRREDDIDSDEAELEAEAAAYIAAHQRAAAPSVAHAHSANTSPKHASRTPSVQQQQQHQEPATQVSRAPSHASMRSAPAQRPPSKLQQPAFFYRTPHPGQQNASAAGSLPASPVAASPVPSQPAAATASRASNPARSRTHSASSSESGDAARRHAAADDWKRKPTVLWGKQKAPGSYSYSSAASAAPPPPERRKTQQPAALRAQSQASAPAYGAVHNGKTSRAADATSIAGSTQSRGAHPAASPHSSPPSRPIDAATEAQQQRVKHEERLRFLQASDGESRPRETKPAVPASKNRRVTTTSTAATAAAAHPPAPVLIPGREGPFTPTKVTRILSMPNLTQELSARTSVAPPPPFVSSQVNGTAATQKAPAAAPGVVHAVQPPPHAVKRAVSVKKKKVPVISVLNADVAGITTAATQQPTATAQPTAVMPSAQIAAQEPPPVPQPSGKTRKQLQQQQKEQHAVIQPPSHVATAPPHMLQQAPPQQQPQPLHHYPPPAQQQQGFDPYMRHPHGAPYPLYQQYDHQPSQQQAQQPMHGQSQTHNGYPGYPPPFYPHLPPHMQPQQPAFMPPHQQHQQHQQQLPPSWMHPGAPPPQGYPPPASHMQQYPPHAFHGAAPYAGGLPVASQQPHQQPYAQPPPPQQPAPAPAAAPPAAASTQPRVHFQQPLTVQRVPSLQQAAIRGPVKGGLARPAPAAAVAPAPARTLSPEPALAARATRPTRTSAPLQQSMASAQEQSLLASLDRLDARLRGEPPAAVPVQQPAPVPARRAPGVRR